MEAAKIFQSNYYIPYAELDDRTQRLADYFDGSVRADVAAAGIALDTLVHDKEPLVRLRVAQQGYGLELLRTDADKGVRDAAKYMLSEANGRACPIPTHWDISRYTKPYVPYEALEDRLKFAVDYGNSDTRGVLAEQGFALDRLKDDPSPGVRLAVAEQGYALDELKDDPNWLVRIIVARQGYALDELKDDPSTRVRIAVVEQGYALDELKDDPNWSVREAVARQGYALDELKDDPEHYVREAVAKQDYALDELKDDPDWRVREAVAEQGYALDELKDDTNWRVREAVARQGYALDELKDDPEHYVRDAVESMAPALLVRRNTLRGELIDYMGKSSFEFDIEGIIADLMDHNPPIRSISIMENSELNEVIQSHSRPDLSAESKSLLSEIRGARQAQDREISNEDGR